jgi:tetratricopeptide (TPR) repeat protein
MPSQAPALEGRAYTYLKMGRLKESIADFDESLRRRPQSATTLFGRGVARRRSGDVAAGDADIAAARKIDPSVDGFYARRGVTP